MVRGLVWTFVVFCIVVSLIVGATIWLLYSSAGAIFVVKRLTGEHGEVSQVEGSFARGISIKGLTIIQDRFNFSAAHLHVVATVSSIYPLKLNLSTVEATDVDVVLHPAPEKDDGQQPSFPVLLPQLPAVFDLVYVVITDLHLNKITLQQPDDVIVVDDLRISASLSNRQLLVDHFSLALDDLSVVAALEADMADPSVRIAATLNNNVTDDYWEKIILHSHLRQADAGIITGTVGAQGSFAGFPSMMVDADIHLVDEMLKIDTLMLRQERREGAIEVSGRLRLDSGGPKIDALVLFHDLDLTAEAGLPLQLAGRVDLSYDPSLYQGRIELISSGHELTEVSLTGHYSGNHQQVVFEQIRALWFDADIDGRLQLDWSAALELEVEADVRELSLDPFVPQSSGLINARVHAGYFHRTGQPRAQLIAELVDSSFHGYPLSGRIDAVYENDNLWLNSLSLDSNSAHLQARGDLLSRLDFTLTLDRLADFYPQADAALTTQGWLRRSADSVEADVHFRVSHLVYDQWQLTSLSGQLALDADQNLTATATAQHLAAENLEVVIDTVNLTSTGTLSDHRLDISVDGQGKDLAASIRGSWSEPSWNAMLETLNISVTDVGWQLREPAQIAVEPEGIRISPLILDGDAIQSIRLHGEYLPGNNSFEVDLSWQDLSLIGLKKWLDPFPVQGYLDGQVRLSKLAEQIEMSISLQSVADLSFQKLYVQETEVRLDLDWGAQGLVGNLRVDIGRPAHLVLQVRSPQAAGFYLPDRVDVELGCRALPLKLIQPWLPDDLAVEGQLGCRINGSWHGEGGFDGEADAAISAGALFWHDGEQSVDIALEHADMHLLWGEEGVHGHLAVRHDYGHVNSNLTMEVPAQLPLSLAETAPITADVDILLRESGLLSVVFPQYLYDSRGRINLSAAVNGTIGQPVFSGSLTVDQAEVYLPTAGVRLHDIVMETQLQSQQLEIVTLAVRSTEGLLTGQGRVDIHGWVPGFYRFSVEGSRFQLVNLPEMTAYISPDLTVEGDSSNVRVRGSIHFPEAIIKDRINPQTIRNSPDLLIIDRQMPEPVATRIAHDVDVNLHLGDQVLLDVAGLEARVGGTLRLYSDPQQEFAAQGRLFVARGRYSTYGVTLDIDRGEIYFPGVPLRYPTLDILALRRAGQVRAGVRISGTPQEPLVTLYSEPVMPDADVLSYIVLGRPLDSSGGDTDLLMVATGALLSQGESIVLQERIKGRLGLDVLEFSAGEGDARDSVITTGKYITPDLYVSLGYSLFNNTNEIRIRYRLTNRLELESSFGQESGVDLFYRLEID